MPRKFFQRLLPPPHEIRDHRHLKRFFGDLVHDANLWHLNRRSVAGAFAVGLFVAFLPIPLQMVLAAALAILFRVNLPLSVVLVFITNPFTIPPLFYLAYKLGSLLLGQTPEPLQIELSLEWVMNQMGRIWQPLLLGSLLLGSLSSALGYVGVRLIWRFHIVSRLLKRRKRKPGT